MALDTPLEANFATILIGTLALRCKQPVQQDTWGFSRFASVLTTISTRLAIPTNLQ